MLTINDYIQIITDLLNSNSQGVKFKIFNDVGDYMVSLRNGNSVDNVVNGIISLSPSTLVPIVNVPMSIITASIEFAINIDIDNPAETDMNGIYAQYPIINKVRDIWDTMAQLNTGLAISKQDSDNNTYSITLGFTLLTDGLLSMNTSDTGEILPMSATVTFTVIDGGVASNSCTLIVNGEQVPFSEMAITRAKMQDTAQYLNPASTSSSTIVPYPSTKSYTLQNGISIDLTTPLLDKSIDNAMLNELIVGDNNRAYAVVLSIGTLQNAFIMTTGNLTGTLSAGSNVGMNLSFLEINPHYIVDNQDNWRVYQGTGNTYIEISGDFEAGTTIFWGDNSYTYLTSYSSLLTHNYTSNFSGNIYVKLGATTNA